MSDQSDMLLVEVALSWRWRCRTESTAIPGSNLRLVEHPGVTLAELRSSRVDVRELRCPCGSLVVPLAPIEDK